MIRILTVLLFVPLMINCTSRQPFDAYRWKAKGLDWQMAEDRELMLADLIDLLFLGKRY